MGRHKTENVIFRSKVAREILFHLNNKKRSCGKKMVENIDKTTQNHVSITTLRLLEEDLIRRVENKNKRTKYYELTEKGKEIVSLLLKIKSLV